jgi:hypothetical protein
MSLLEHAFAYHVHLGTLGELMCIRMETSLLILIPLMLMTLQSHN